MHIINSVNNVYPAVAIDVTISTSTLVRKNTHLKLYNLIIIIIKYFVG